MLHSEPMHTLILGAGYSGLRIGRQALAHGAVCGTRREQGGLDEVQRWGLTPCQLNGRISSQLREQLAKTTHLISSVAPAREAPLNDPMHTLMASLTRKDLPSLRWLGYLSTIGVYGDHNGAWIDEQTPCISTQPRSLMRREAELAWQQSGTQLNVPVSILRLSGIYGPGRNAVEDAIKGRARMLIKPGQVFNRIHVDDLAQATLKAAMLEHDGVLNITDDLPAPPQVVIRYAHELAGRTPPSAVDFATADISPMARSFYSENKRVRNALSKRQLDLQYRYPTYKSALAAIWNSLK